MECRLDATPCPGPSCAFWLRDGCLIDKVDLAGREQLTAFLIELRDGLAPPLTTEAAALHRALSEGKE